MCKIINLITSIIMAYEKTENERIRLNMVKLRKGSHMSQSEVAAKLGMNLSTYKHIERVGGTDIIHRGIEKMPKLFGVTPESFFCGNVNGPDMVNEERSLYGNSEQLEKIIEMGEELIRKGEEMTCIGRELVDKLGL